MHSQKENFPQKSKFEFGDAALYVRMYVCILWHLLFKHAHFEGAVLGGSPVVTLVGSNLDIVTVPNGSGNDMTWHEMT